MKYEWLIAGAGLFAVLACEPARAESQGHNWSGCYMGAHAGGLWGRTDHGIDGPPVPPAYQRDVTFSDFTAGAHAGCNYQIHRWVFGVEGDLNWSPVDASVLVFSGATAIQTYRDKLDRYGTVRGRVGIAEGRWHLFGTAGIAFSNLELSFHQVNLDVVGVENYARRSSQGWVAGAGLEYALLPDWIARIEYLHHRFDGGLLLNAGGQHFWRAHEPHFHVVRFGITRKFGSQP